MAARGARTAGRPRAAHRRDHAVPRKRSRNKASPLGCNATRALFETLCFQNGLGGRRGKERDQHSYGVSLTAAGNDALSKNSKPATDSSLCVPKTSSVLILREIAYRRDA